MATQSSFVEYVAEQAGLGERLTAKRMFGEYGLYIDGKVVAFACDDSLFVKPADDTADLCAELPRRPPYPGAKPYPVADELLDDSDALRRLLLATFAAVPGAKETMPKERKVAKAPTAVKAATAGKAGKGAKTATAVGTAKGAKTATAVGTAKGAKRAKAAKVATAPKTAKVAVARSPKAKRAAVAAQDPKATRNRSR